MSSTAKLTFYSSVASQWAGVVHLGLAEKKYDMGSVEIKEIDLVEGKNLEPEYLKINPNGTIPSLVVPSQDQPLIDSRQILEYLDEASPKPSETPTLTPTESATKAKTSELIELVHSSKLDTNLILLGARNDAELDEKSHGGWGTFIAARQAVVEKQHEADPNNSFYAQKVKDNGAINHIYTTGPGKERDAFFQDTQKRYVEFAAAMDELNDRLRLPYATGTDIVLADLHIVPWLSHAMAGVGTVDPSDFGKLETHIGQSVPGFKIGENVRAWWLNFGKRESFKKVFPKLH